MSKHRAEEPDIHPEDVALKDGTSLFDLVGAKYVESMENKIQLTEHGQKKQYKKDYKFPEFLGIVGRTNPELVAKLEGLVNDGTVTAKEALNVLYGLDPKRLNTTEVDPMASENDLWTFGNSGKIHHRGEVYILDEFESNMASCWPPVFKPPFGEELVCSKCKEGILEHGYKKEYMKSEEEYEMEDRKYKTGSHDPRPDKPLDVRYSHQADLEKDADPVNHPAHYTAYKGLEIIQLTEQMNFNRGNAVKYIARAGLKEQSTEIEDLEKAKWYIQREIERISE